jgi:hypothetical protein
MYVQFSQGLPGVVVEKDKQRIYIDTAGENFLKEMEDTFQHYSDNDFDYFSVGKDYAAGFFEMLKAIKDFKEINYFKGQVIGPISFGLTVKDQDSKPVFYNKDLQEIIVKSLALKAKWQIREVKKQLAFAQGFGELSAEAKGESALAKADKNEKVKIIIFLDEPYLVSVGSSYIPLKKEEVVSQINEVVFAIHQESALAGIHCCGNTDWGLVLESQIDILDFDAYNFLDTVLLYPEQLSSFFNRGGILAWGIVPTSEKEIKKDFKNSLINKILKAGEGKDILKNQIIITPSCGCGTLSVELAETIHKLAVEVARELNSQKNL